MRIRNYGKILAGILSICLAIAGPITDYSVVSANCVAGSASTTTSQQALTGQTAAEIVEAMGFGINLGNSLDATSNFEGGIYGQEKSWGNPQVTKELIAAIKENGMNCVRVPITWMLHTSKDGKYTIDSEWLARVKEIVDAAYEADLYIIINSHHDDWFECSDLDTKQDELAVAMARLWAQIADYFANYDQHLIFEGMNEPTDCDDGNGDHRDWTGGCATCNQTINYLNQVFVDTVRDNAKGYNSERLLMVQGYAAGGEKNALEAISLPTYQGKTDDHIAVSIHCYRPYQFCIEGGQTTFDPNNTADTNEINAVFEAVDELFLSNGIPVILGETSATTNDNTASRKKWAYYMGAKAASYGIPLILWDNGVKDNGKECHSWLDRSNYQLNAPTVFAELFKGKKSTEWGSARKKYEDKKSAYLPATTLSEVQWQNAKGSSIDWSTYVSFSPVDSLFYEGRSIAIVYTGNSAPILAMSSESFAKKELNDGVNYWWITVNASSTETLGSKKVAYYKAEDIRKALKEVNSDLTPEAISDIRLTCNGATVYEVNAVGTAQITFKANGVIFAVSNTIPTKKPVGKDSEFVGWYTTPDYREGTEFTKVSQASGLNFTVYAKFAYEGDLLADSTNATPKKTSLSSIANDKKGVKLSWKKNSTATGYVIYRSINNGKYTKLCTIKNNSTISYTDTKVSNGKKYSYKIKAYAKKNGKTVYASVSSAKTVVFLKQPTITSSKNIKTKSIEVQYKKNSSATGYRIRYVLGSKTVTKTVSKNSTLKYKFTKLQKNKTYKIYVAAYKRVGKTTYYSAWSEVTKVKVTK